MHGKYTQILKAKHFITFIHKYGHGKVKRSKKLGHELWINYSKIQISTYFSQFYQS